MSTTNSISYSAALGRLERLFSSKPGTDRRPAEELLANWGGRDIYTPDANKIWLRNKITELTKYGLVLPINTGPQRTLTAVQLTAKGNEHCASVHNQMRLLSQLMPILRLCQHSDSPNLR